MSAPGLTGVIMTGCGGLAMIVSNFLQQFGGQSLWAVTTRQPAILTFLALLALSLAGVSLLTSRNWLAPAQLAIGFYLFGEVFYVGQDSYAALGLGFWLGAIAGLVMAVGGALSVAAVMPRRPA